MLRAIKRLLPRTLGGSRDGVFSLLFEKASGFDREAYGSHLRDLLLSMRKSPCRIMEIGVEDGWGAKVMIEAAKKRSEKVEYYGFDLWGELPIQKDLPVLERIRRRIVGRENKMEELKSKLEELGCICHLYRGDSTKTLPPPIPNLPKMDFIHIDGGHSYEVVRQDWFNARRLMHSETVVVFDDYPLEGVRRVVEEIEKEGKYCVRVEGGYAIVTNPSSI